MLFALVAAVFISSSDTLLRSPPEAVGMSSERLAQVDRVLSAGVDAGAFPGAAVVIVRRGAIVHQRGVGRLGWASDDARVDPERSLYDVASLTKVMATSLAVLMLHDDGALTLDDAVATHLPEFAGARGTVTIRQLLTHQSGLPVGTAFRDGDDTDGHRRRLLATPLISSPGGRPIYSDVGPMILALLVERVSGTPLDEFLVRRAYGPMRLRHTHFRPSVNLRHRIAPTAATIAGERGSRGIVHDRHARLMGGVAGHAGLFSSAHDVAAFAQMVLNGGHYGGRRILRDSTAAAFSARVSGWRALGWSTCHGGGSCGQRLGPDAFGHTGFTGTSVWIDPQRELVIVLLTNWVHRPLHAAADPRAVLSDVRADIADIAALAITDGVEDTPLPPRLRVDRAAGWYTPVGP